MQLNDDHRTPDATVESGWPTARLDQSQPVASVFRPRLCDLVDRLAPRHRPGPRNQARTQGGNGDVSRLVIWLLRSPVHRLLSRSVILLTIVGRKSGRSMTFPVQYAASGNEIIVFPGHFERKQWWRNLQEPAPVEMLLGGTNHTGIGRSLAAAPGASDQALEQYLRRFPRAGRAAHSARDEARRRKMSVPMVMITNTVG